MWTGHTGGDDFTWTYDPRTKLLRVSYPFNDPSGNPYYEDSYMEWITSDKMELRIENGPVYYELYVRKQ